MVLLPQRIGLIDPLSPIDHCRFGDIVATSLLLELPSSLGSVPITLLALLAVRTANPVVPVADRLGLDESILILAQVPICLANTHLVQRRLLFLFFMVEDCFTVELALYVLSPRDLLFRIP